MAQQLRVRRAFSTLTDQQIIALTGAVISGLNNNTAFPKPPVEAATVQAELDQLVAAIANLSSGDPQATATRNNKREALVATLRQLATFVEVKSNNDLATLLSSGFTAMTANRLPSPLSKPSITLIDNGHSTQLIVRVRAVPSAKSYEVRAAAIGAGGVQGAWQPGGIFTSSRSMPVNGLVPGTSYTFQVRAVGGSTGFSDWSDPLSHMCM